MYFGQFYFNYFSSDTVGLSTILKIFSHQLSTKCLQNDIVLDSLISQENVGYCLRL
jgi:hypothetical protein